MEIYDLIVQAVDIFRVTAFTFAALLGFCLGVWFWFKLLRGVS